MIEIIPKPKISIPLWLSILFYSSIVTVILLITGFFVINSFEKKAADTLSTIENLLSQSRTIEEAALEKRVFSYRDKINDFAILVDQRKDAVKFFDLIEKITHPKVWFSNTSVDIKSSKVILAGQADSFPTVGQQIMIFKNEPMIKKTNLDSLHFDRGGMVGFSVSFSLDPKVFK